MRSPHVADGRSADFSIWRYHAFLLLRRRFLSLGLLHADDFYFLFSAGHRLMAFGQRKPFDIIAILARAGLLYTLSKAASILGDFAAGSAHLSYIHIF